MKASTYIKDHGLPSLAHVAKIVNKHPDTINNWYKKEFDLFEIIVLGCVSKQPIITTPISLVAGTGETTIGCMCDWIGSPSQLVDGGCPDCGKEFVLFPPPGYCVSKGTDDD